MQAVSADKSTPRQSKKHAGQGVLLEEMVGDKGFILPT
jgi:hypothetical protein